MPAVDQTKGQLLRRNSLKGVHVGISVSESPDLQRLGLLEVHFRLALGELARTILVSGGQLNYGGHIDPGGYTAFVIHELQRFNRRDRPFHSILAWTEHRRVPIDRLREQRRALGLYGDLTGLDLDGREIDLLAERPAEAATEFDDATIAKSLTSMRRYLTEHSDGRIFIGGKRSGFKGEMPGLMEEALLALNAGQPIYLAGGFGGVTSDVAQALSVGEGDWLPPDSSGAAPDERWKSGLERLAAWRASGNHSLNNGLTDGENRILAVSHRPSEIAALVGLGLGRRLAN